jgi:hypothetical protein
MIWIVNYHEDYLTELRKETEELQDAVLSLVPVLQLRGPQLGRPYADTLKGSTFTNMKELRITLPDGEWRVAFAFDAERKAILLVGGSKSGVNERKFYQKLIRTADERFTKHLTKLNKEKGV